MPPFSFGKATPDRQTSYRGSEEAAPRKGLWWWKTQLYMKGDRPSLYYSPSLYNLEGELGELGEALKGTFFGKAGGKAETGKTYSLHSLIALIKNSLCALQRKSSAELSSALLLHLNTRSHILHTTYKRQLSFSISG